MDGDHFAHLSGGGGAGVGSRFDRAHITAHHDSNQTGANLLIPHQSDIAAFAIASAASMFAGEPPCFDHTQSFLCHC